MFEKRIQETKYKPLKYRGIWLAIGYILVFFTVLLCLMPNPPDTSAVQFGDKLVHLTGYLCLFLWFAQIYSRENHYRPLIALVFLGVAIELAQSLTDYRAFEVMDILANTGGVLLGWLVAGSFIGFTLINLETFVFKKIKRLVP